MAGKTVPPSDSSVAAEAAALAVDEAAATEANPVAAAEAETAEAAAADTATLAVEVASAADAADDAADLVPPIEPVEGERSLEAAELGASLIPMAHPDGGTCDRYELDAAGNILVPADDVGAMIEHGFVPVPTEG